MRRLALRAYNHYARYLVELMRLPSLSPEVIADLVEPEGLADLERIWRESDGVILAVGHVGNNEACAAGVASRGWPISVVADDSSFPEMFELFRQLRESYGVAVIPWRNLRKVYEVLRRKEMLALLVDWGYRADGIPVRLFDAWTTLPAGPASLAAKTGATILPVVIRRTETGRFRVDVRRADPASRQRARPSSSGRRRRWPIRSSGRSPPRPTSGTASSRCGRRPTRRPTSSPPGPPRCRPTRARRTRAARAAPSPPGPPAGRRCRVAPRGTGAPAPSREADDRPAEAVPG